MFKQVNWISLEDLKGADVQLVERIDNHQYVVIKTNKGYCALTSIKDQDDHQYYVCDWIFKDVLKHWAEYGFKEDNEDVIEELVKIGLLDEVGIAMLNKQREEIKLKQHDESIRVYNYYKQYMLKHCPEQL